jgi:hypothetical protein
MQTPQCSNIHPANLIRHAYTRFEYVCANTIGAVNVHILNSMTDRKGKMVKT